MAATPRVFSISIQSPQIRAFAKNLSLKDRDIDNLNIIHVAGTKGKASTCAFIRSFLRVHGSRTGFPQNVGMYTSPHLRFTAFEVYS